MPETGRTDQCINETKAKEVISLMDKLASLAGTEPFSKQIDSLMETAKANRKNIKDSTTLSDKEVNELINVLPEMMTETICETFGAISMSMQQALSDPEKLKAALNKQKS